MPSPAVTAVSYDKLRITWTEPQTPNGRILNYVLQRNESTPWSVNSQPTNVSLQYIDSSLVPDTTYVYRVSACTVAGCTTSAATSGRTRQHVPSLMTPPLAETLNATAVEVSWTSPAQPNGRITLYRVLLNNTEVYSGLSTSHQVTGLRPYVVCEFVVSACTSVGCTASQPTTSRTDEAPPTGLAPATLRVTGTRSVEVSWQPPARPNGLITAYELRRNGSLVQLTTESWYIDYDCQPGTTYSYRVTAYNSRGSVDSIATVATTLSATPGHIQPPSLTVLSSADIAVSWRAPSAGQVVNYTLYMNNSVVYTGVAVSTVVRHLTPWTQYGFHVAACTLGGCTTSHEVQVRTFEAAPAGLEPPILEASVVGQISVHWKRPRSANGHIVAYELYRRHVNDSVDMQGFEFYEF